MYLVVSLKNYRRNVCKCGTHLPRCLAASLPRCLAASLPRCLAAASCLPNFPLGRLGRLGRLATLCPPKFTKNSTTCSHYNH
jgi:hypothetical protein